MFKLVIKGSTPQELETNVQNFIMSRIDAVESFKEEFDAHKKTAEVKTYPTYQDLGYATPQDHIAAVAKEIKIDQTLTKITEPLTFMPDYTPAVQPISHPVHGAHDIGSNVKVSNEIFNQAAATTINSSELDSRGISWDARIHTDKKTKNMDGSWRNKRGVDKGVLAQVEAELKSNPASQQVQAPVVTPPFAAPPIDSHANTQPMAFVPPVAAAPTQQPSVAPMEYAPPIAIPNGTRPAYTLYTFQDNLMGLIAQLINEGKIDQNYIESLKKYFKVKEIWNVLGSAVQTREMYESFVKYGFITKVD